MTVSRTNSGIPGLQSISNSNEAFRRRIKARKYATLSPSSGEAKLESGFFKPELVIFDKDGTLVCFHTMWSPWCKGLADRMNRLTGRDLAEPVYDVLGYDHKVEKVYIGNDIEHNLLINILGCLFTFSYVVLQVPWQKILILKSKTKLKKC